MLEDHLQMSFLKGVRRHSDLDRLTPHRRVGVVVDGALVLAHRGHPRPNVDAVEELHKPCQLTHASSQPIRYSPACRTHCPQL